MSDKVEYPGFIRRTMVVVYDLLIFTAITMATLALIVIVAMLASDNQLQQNQQTLYNNPLITLAIIATTYWYYGYSLVKKGQTLGMMAWHVKIVGLDGKPATWQQAAVRYALSLAGVANIIMFFNPERRGWQDIASQTLQLLIKPTKEESKKSS